MRNKRKTPPSRCGSEAFLHLWGYVVKGDEREQSINEFVAQHLLGALGFYSIPVELICSNYTYYGAVRFVEGLERLHWDDYPNLIAAQQKAFIELFVLNGMLYNPDEGEFYLTKTGEVCSLDYGESIIGTFIPKIALSGMPQFLPSSRRDIEQSEYDNICLMMFSGLPFIKQSAASTELPKRSR